MSHLEVLLAEYAISKTVTGYMNAVDTGRWDDVGEFFADEVFLDYTSVRATPPAATLSKADAIARWRNKFGKEIAYQHRLSNLEVTVRGGEATCTGNNNADHVMTDEAGRIVLWQIGVRLTWKLSLNKQASWVINSVQAEYIWDRTQPFDGMKVPPSKKGA